MGHYDEEPREAKETDRRYGRRRSRDRGHRRSRDVELERSRSSSRDRRARRSFSPSRRREVVPKRHSYSHRERSRSRSPPPKRRRRDSNSRSPRVRRSRSRSPPRRQHSDRHHRPRPRVSPPQSPPPSKRSRGPLPNQNDAFSKTKPASSDVVRQSPPPEKQTANYAPSGLLAAETNKVANTSIILKYNEPPESRLPPASQPWRLYVFKDSDVLETLNLYERTSWLFGRERMVVNHLTEHPSCSKQHAVLQFRHTEKKDEWGERKGRVKLYVLDLESANGTSLNGERVPERRYLEVKSGDVVKFGDSTREYVALLPPKEKKEGEG